MDILRDDSMKEIFPLRCSWNAGVYRREEIKGSKYYFYMPLTTLTALYNSNNSENLISQIYELINDVKKQIIASEDFGNNNHFKFINLNIGFSKIEEQDMVNL